MNERIKELGTLAGLYMESTMPGGFPNEQLINAERFAELIVRECIDIAQARAAFDWAPHNDVNIIIDEIKEHFGVEGSSDEQEREERLRNRSTYFGNE
jgi:hypothetical protein